MPRTVYILGAGFSYPAKIPVQAALLDRVRELGIMDAPANVIDTFLEAQSVSLDFIRALSRSAAAPPLEDAFTLLDHTISSRGYALGYTWQQLVVVRERLQQALLFVIHSAAEHAEKKLFYRNVASHVLARAVGPAENTAAVLSLNWDPLVEDSAFAVIRDVAGIGRMDVNFGCDTLPLRSPSAHSPSLTQDARRLVNVAALKLHGSANWLICPNCTALFTGAGVEASPWDLYFGDVNCPACGVAPGAPEIGTAPLQPFLVTPSFLKVFDNVHIQATWQRAYHLLARADELVFAGYSMPVSDFHFRALLRRSVRRAVRVTAVLTSSDEFESSMPAATRGHFAATRYREFFGDVTLDTRGVEGFFAEIFASHAPEQNLALLRALVGTVGTELSESGSPKS